MSTTPLNKLLVKAIKSENLDRVSKLLNIGANPKYVFREKGKRTSLIDESQRLGNSEISKILLDHAERFGNT